MVGADNIAVTGLSVGVPAAVDTSGISVSGVSNLGDAANAANDATSSLAGASEDAQKAAEDMRKGLDAFKPSLVSVEVLGFGDEEDECNSGNPITDAACRKRREQKGGS